MEENESLSYNTQEQEGKSTDFFAIAKLCLIVLVKNWRWYLLSLVLCLFFATIYKMREPHIFTQTATILLEDSNNDNYYNRNGFSGLKDLYGVQVTDELKNEIFILQSRRLMEKVVDRLGLNISYNTFAGLRPVALFTIRPFTAHFGPSFHGPLSFDVEVSKGDRLKVSNVVWDGQKYKFERTFTYGQVVQTPGGAFRLDKEPDAYQFVGRTVRVSRVSKEAATSTYVSRLSAAEYDKEAQLINISMRDINKSRAQAVLNTLLQVYKEDIVDAKNMVSANTAKFIDNRIRLIGSELSQVEGELARFKRNNDFVDFQLNAKSYLTQSETSRKDLMDLESQLTVAQYLKEYISKEANNKSLIPQLTGLGSANMQTQISDYNKLMIERNKMASNSSETASPIADRDAALASMRRAINASIDSYTNSIRLQLAKARSVDNQLQSQLTGVPDKEIKALDITRQQSIKEALYTYLLNKREEVALQLAINEANVRIVEYPYGPAQPASRSWNIILLVALLVGFAIPSLIIWARTQLNTKVRARKEVEDNLSAPILGSIPRWDEDGNEEKLLSKKSAASSVAEAFRILRYNIDMVAKRPAVIMTTSSTPSQGKSFTSRNLAVIFGIAGKKVLLVDADIRKG